MENRTAVMLKIAQLAVAAAAVLLLAAILWGGGFCNDEAEHLHATWLVAHGQVPYRDFFEHHHPLLWYLLAPVVKIGGRTVELIYVSRVLSVLCYVGGIYAAYRLNRDFLFGKKTAVFGVMFLLLWAPLFYDMVYLRPDAPMMWCFIEGVYFLLAYLRDGRRRWLGLSYFFAAASFWFLQKAAMWLVAFGVVNLYLWWRKKISVQNAFAAVALPSLVTVGYLWYLYSAGALEMFGRLSYELNWAMRDYFGNCMDSAFVSVLKISGMMLWLAAVLLGLKREAKRPYGGIVLALGGGMMLGWLMFAPYDYYLLPFFVLLSGFGGRLLELLINKFRVAAGIVCALLLVALVLITGKCVLPNNNFAQAMKVWDYVIENTDENDVVLNGNIIINLFNADADWRWFGFHGVSFVYDALAGEKYDRNAVIRQSRPELLEPRDIPNEIRLMCGGADEAYETDIRYIRQFYAPVDELDINNGFELWRRKGGGMPTVGGDGENSAESVALTAG